MNGTHKTCINIAGLFVLAMFASVTSMGALNGANAGINVKEKEVIGDDSSETKAIPVFRSDPKKMIKN